MQGEPLTELIDAAAKQGAVPDRPAYAETEYPRRAFGWSALRAMRSGKYLLVEAPRKELYDQSTDPNAKRDLAASSTAVTQTLAGKLDSFVQSSSSAAPAADKNVDPEAQEKLSALGYVASSGEDKVDPGVKDTGADPKDKVEIVNLLHDAILYVEDTRYEEAVPLLQKVLATESGIPIAYMQLGTAYTWLKEYDKAIPVLEKAVEMRPDTLMSQYELGLSLSETGDWEKAMPHFKAAVEKSPKWAALHFSLAAAYGHLGQMDESRKELETTLTLNPDDYRANLILGGMMIAQGKAAQGVANLKKAARLQPNAPEPHQFLAEAYGRLGQKANAERERLQADRLRGASTP
jgi:tetratricopeptide (TPR) repeat protein